MTDDIQSLLMSEMFVPNCKIRIKGDHFFADRKLYTNMYGMAFFSAADDYSENPHLSSACAGLPGILDEYFGDDAIHRGQEQEGEMSHMITSLIDEKYLIKEKQKNVRKLRWLSDCSFIGNISFKDGSYVISYGTVLPTTLCLTDDALTGVLPFSPFTNISMLKGKRTLQSVEYPLPREIFSPPEDITIDFAVNSKKLNYYFSDDLQGKIEIEYSVEVGVTKCENSKMIFEITRLNQNNDLSE